MKRSTEEEYERRVLLAQRFLEERIDEAVSPTEVAAVASMSLHHFHRVFRGMCGESVMGFTRRLRLERAARQLRGSSRPVLEIAIDAGYASHEAFTRAFSSRFDSSPSAFRDAVDEPASASSPCVAVAPPDEVVVRDEPQRNVLYMRHTGPYETVGEVWNRFVAWHVQHLGAPTRMYALVPDDPSVTATDHLRYDACFEIDSEVDACAIPPGPVSAGVLPAGRYAVVTHEGPYATLGDSYLALIGGWFPKSGHALAAEPVIEHYLNSPEDTPPHALRTEIRVSIEQRGWMR